MTDTAARQTKSTKANNGMRSTHPSYSEYNFENLIGRANNVRPPQNNQQSRASAPQSSAKQPQTGSVKGNTKSFQNAAQSRGSRQNQPRTGSAANTYRASAAAANTAYNPAGQRLNQEDAIRRRRTEAQQRRETELRRRETNLRQEKARKLAEETQKRAKAAAKAAARQAKKAQAKAIKALNELNTIKSDSRYTFPAAILMTALAFTVLVLAIVTTSVQISEITIENAALQRSYNQLVAEQNKLSMELEVRDDLRTVENLAKNEYGMVKQDQVERYYLKTYQSDRIELIEETAEESTNWFDSLSGAVKAFVGRFVAFFRK